MHHHFLIKVGFLLGVGALSLAFNHAPRANSIVSVSTNTRPIVSLPVTK